MKNELKTVDQYIETFDSETQKILEKLRTIIREIAPEAVESIAYGMPAYKTNGKPLVYFAGYNKHIGFYATPSGHSEFANELSKYKQGKGSVQFPLNQPIPFDLIKRMVKFRVRENIPKTEPKKNEVIDGYTIKYHANGKTKWSKGKIVDHKPQGYWEWYRIDGTIKRSGHFEKGEPIGEWITYDKEGKVYKLTKK